MFNLTIFGPLGHDYLTIKYTSIIERIVITGNQEKSSPLDTNFLLFGWKNGTDIRNRSINNSAIK